MLGCRKKMMFGARRMSTLRKPPLAYTHRSLIKYVMRCAAIWYQCLLSKRLAEQALRSRLGPSGRGKRLGRMGRLG